MHVIMCGSVCEFRGQNSVEGGGGGGGGERECKTQENFTFSVKWQK